MNHEINPSLLVCAASTIFFLGWAFRAATHAKRNKVTTIIAAAIALIAVALIICMTVSALIVCQSFNGA